MLQEFYQVAFRKKLYESIEQPQADVDEWQRNYNEERPQRGKFCFGKTPRQIFDDPKKLAEQKMLDQLYPMQVWLADQIYLPKNSQQIDCGTAATYD